MEKCEICGYYILDPVSCEVCGKQLCGNCRSLESAAHVVKDGKSTFVSISAVSVCKDCREAARLEVQREAEASNGGKNNAVR